MPTLPSRLRTAFRLGWLTLLLLASVAHGQGQAPDQAATMRLVSANDSADWASLDPAQQRALAPLADQWATLDASQKRRWLAIGQRYVHMQPKQQARLQQRMREWSALTPEERRVARDSYIRARKLKPHQKNAEWEQYQLLTPQQKKQLAEEAAARRRLDRLPAPAPSAPSSPSSSIHNNQP